MTVKPSNFGDMPVDEFKKYGYRIVDQIAEYFENIEQYPVLSQVEPDWLKDNLPASAPETGEDFGDILDDVDKLIMPAVTHWNHPNFHGLFSTSTSSVGVFAEMFAAAFDMKAMLWRTSPASTELEDVVLDWLRQMMGLPERFEGIIYDTASVSTMHAIAAARERAGLHIREQGMSGRDDLPLLRVYASEHVHSSIDKGVITLGLGLRSLRKIECNDRLEMIPEKLALAIEEDIANGYLPICVIPTVGTTSTSSIDPVYAIADICEKYGIWLHVDTAYAGSTAIIPEMQVLFKGWERADSIVVNPHKWLFTPFDLSVLYCKDLSILKEAFSLVAEYLKTSDEQTVKNGMDYGIQLGRRFRALKLWFVIRYFGREGLIARLREHCRLARLFATWVEKSPDFELMAPVPFALVCFRAKIEGLPEDGIDQLNERIMNDINASGDAYLSHTKLNGRFTLRLSVGSIRVEERHLRKVWGQLNSQLHFYL
ncbi:MAG TPA: pyridoxal-dependent decarboxylase [Pyrinomonadaceae bacterium]|nr:amino acid decarboxylase [Chloracidobacterium sp.]MBP9934367.1 aspartate aminotransferase family protein [Pyrinomonadaceae bacterium]MBK9436756.1 amino acid decarboxylase [Chloracidobacterium sp.]MBK9766397.1 amino acid decarboxylase [Chloracidobacterium sp.]MBL0241747.1 amino acid decarboxylase [Chloracidobacterium sp.]